MKIFPNYIVILSCCLILISCNSKQTQEEQKKEQFEDAFNTTQELQEKAALDSNFANSKEYSSQMEKAAIEMSKKTYNMNSNEKMLLEFEVALKSLKQSMAESKRNPELSKNLTFAKNIQAKANKVLVYQQNIKKLDLNQTEKKKFQDLCR